MDNAPTPKISSGWASNMIVVVVYIAAISGVFLVTQNNTNRNADDIKKQERIHREDMQRMENVILDGFREVRREINEIKK